ncbi:unnamed protein product [Schistosoma curassoni]|uniref:Uncharacterized protein n=1 Tax=Schistosoma curassoni TaxID=6186 RepID=A0A183L552_9TREM|nr:unnamed protein product [Schistosoma curassoni]
MEQCTDEQCHSTCRRQRQHCECGQNKGITSQSSTTSSTSSSSPQSTSSTTTIPNSQCQVV